MAIRSEFGSACIRLHDHGFALDRLPGVVARTSINLTLVLGHRHNIAVVKIHNLVRDSDERHCVAGDKVFALAQTNDHGRTLTRTHDTLGVTFVENCHRIGTRHTGKRLFERLQKVILKIEIDQMCEHFGVRLALHGNTCGFELGSQLSEVFDDAVVHQCNAVARNVRVCIGNHRASVRSPPSMRNAHSPLHAFGPHLLGQILDTRHTAGAVNFTVAHDCDATAVVATVLKAL